MSDQGSFFDAAETPLRPRETVCPACNGSLDSPAERREGRCRRCIASGARALKLVTYYGETLHACRDCGRMTSPEAMYQGWCQRCLADSVRGLVVE